MSAPIEPGTVPRADGAALVVVRFKGERKGCYHNRGAVALWAGQYCLVEADRGCDLGQVVRVGPATPDAWREAAEQGVLSLASAEDLARLPDLRREEREARAVARERILDHGLPMDLVGVERRWDRRKLTFYFLAEGRIDFRALVRDLAGIFRTRIELRQIGVRDEARLKGGLGVCGRAFCCATFLGDFNAVSLRMAKDQQLALNPGKLSGPCGRLRCCLAFEHTVYQELLREMPRPGGQAAWGERSGRVRKLDPLRGTVTLQFAGEEPALVEVPVAELTFDGPAAFSADLADAAGAAQAGDRAVPGRGRPRRRGRRRADEPRRGPER